MGKRIDFLIKIKDEFMNLAPYLERIKDTLTCLSCMKFLERPMMMQCGHSVCKAVSKSHLLLSALKDTSTHLKKTR